MSSLANQSWPQTRLAALARVSFPKEEKSLGYLIYSLETPQFSGFSAPEIYNSGWRGSGTNS